MKKSLLLFRKLPIVLVCINLLCTNFLMAQSAGQVVDPSTGSPWSDLPSYSIWNFTIPGTNGSNNSVGTWNVTEYSTGWRITFTGEYLIYAARIWQGAGRVSQLIGKEADIEYVALTSWGSNYGSKDKFAVGMSIPKSNNSGTSERLTYLNSKPTSDQYALVTCGRPGCNQYDTPPYEMNSATVKLTREGQTYKASQVVIRPYFLRMDGGCRYSGCPSPTHSKVFYRLWVKKKVFPCNFQLTDETSVNAENCGSTEGYVTRAGVVPVAAGKTVNLRDWFVNNTGTSAQVYVQAPGQTGYQEVGGSNFAYNFSNQGTYWVRMVITKNGVKCCLGPIQVKAYPCENCLADESRGNNRDVYKCFPEPLTNYPSLVFKFNCATGTWDGGVGSPDGNFIPYGMFTGTVNPENYRPGCKDCGGLAANMYAYKYLMPKSNGASRQMNYVVLTEPFSTYNTRNWKAFTTVDQAAGTTKLLIQSASNFGEFTTVFQEDLGSNMANAPGSLTPYGFYPPNHEYYTKPNSTCQTNWTNITAVTGAWSENANLGGVEANCRTFNKPLRENSNELYRIRVCNPCSVNGFFLIPEADFEVTADLNYSQGTRIGQSNSPTTAGGKINIHLKNNAEFLNCSKQYPNVTSAVSNRDLPSNCPTGDDSPNGSNTAARQKVTLISEGTEDPELLQTALYPNPFNDRLTIRYTMAASGNGSYSVSDMSGKTVVSKVQLGSDKNETVSEVLDTTAWPSGVYLITIDPGNGKQLTKKVIKK
ncbi:T9SS type A sorting domain-containing protein [Flavobacteriaceae bacterium M23B6Z8]